MINSSLLSTAYWSDLLRKSFTSTPSTAFYLSLSVHITVPHWHQKSIETYWVFVLFYFECPVFGCSGFNFFPSNTDVMRNALLSLKRFIVSASHINSNYISSPIRLRRSIFIQRSDFTSGPMFTERKDQWVTRNSWSAPFDSESSYLLASASK